jgi:hypothetical protein
MGLGRLLEYIRDKYRYRFAFNLCTSVGNECENVRVGQYKVIENTANSARILFGMVRHSGHHTVVWIDVDFCLLQHFSRSESEQSELLGLVANSMAGNDETGAKRVHNRENGQFMELLEFDGTSIIGNILKRHSVDNSRHIELQWSLRQPADKWIIEHSVLELEVLVNNQRHRL